jgi:hypothetical protein
MVAAIGNDPRGAYSLLNEIGVPIFVSDGTPPQSVRVENHWPGYFEGPVPFPKNAAPNIGSDSAMVVEDLAAGVGYDFWRIRHEASGWVAAYASRFSLRGDGVTGQGATGSAMPLVDGLIRPQEIAGGRINHAIAVATQDSAGTFRYPATKTDGHNPYPPGIPEGARLQLDPSVDCAAISGIAPAEVTICRALQGFGAYVKDTSASKISVGFQDAGPIGPGNPYYAAGLHWDYFALSHIPWNRLRVLARWDGG